MAQQLGHVRQLVEAVLRDARAAFGRAVVDEADDAQAPLGVLVDHPLDVGGARARADDQHVAQLRRAAQPAEHGEQREPQRRERGELDQRAERREHGAHGRGEEPRCRRLERARHEGRGHEARHQRLDAERAGGGIQAELPEAERPGQRGDEAEPEQADGGGPRLRGRRHAGERGEHAEAERGHEHVGREHEERQLFRRFTQHRRAFRRVAAPA